MVAAIVAGSAVDIRPEVYAADRGWAKWQNQNIEFLFEAISLEQRILNILNIK